MTNTTGWNIWRGDGECPVNKEAIVDIRLRSGKIIEAASFGRCLWARPQREVEGNWSPHATENGGVIVAKWSPDDRTEIRTADGGYAYEDGAWVFGYWDGGWYSKYIHPTHWQPLTGEPAT